MRKLLALSLIFLSGCAATQVAVPVAVPFPTVPETLVQECEKLRQLPQAAKLSDIMITITENYMKYHECSLKIKGWNSWYLDQKAIYENATKK